MTIAYPWLKFEDSETLVIRFDQHEQENPGKLLEKLNAMIIAHIAGSKRFLSMQKTNAFVLHPGNIKKVVMLKKIDIT